LAAFLALFLATTAAEAQTDGTGGGTFLAVGEADASFTGSSAGSAFGDVNFKPIFLWRLSDRLFVESEVEVETGDGTADFGLEYANVVWAVRPNVLLHAGRFISKFGGYFGRYREGFLNRFSSDPVGFGDDGIGARVETGIGVGGTVPLGKVGVTYDFYLSNGPQLLVGSPSAPEQAGQLDYEAYAENNDGKAVGGRVGVLPFADESLEVGASFQRAGGTGGKGTPFEDVGATMYAVDGSYLRLIDPLAGQLRLRSEWRRVEVDRADFPDPSNPLATYSFDNVSSAYYVEGSFRATQSERPVIRDLELAARYSRFEPPADAPWGGDPVNRTEVGLDYWLKWNVVAKTAYVWDSGARDAFEAQLVFGF
jgi:hypothetical protein